MRERYSGTMLAQQLLVHASRHPHEGIRGGVDDGRGGGTASSHSGCRSATSGLSKRSWALPEAVSPATLPDILSMPTCPDDASMGLPCIATNFSGPTALLSARNSYALPPVLELPGGQAKEKKKGEKRLSHTSLSPHASTALPSHERPRDSSPLNLTSWGEVHP